jgi:hypothetical protein
METRETKNCPYCGEEILAVAKKCKHCGEWLPEQPKPKQMVPCPICGEEVEEGTEVCPHCKEKIDVEPTPETVQESRPSSSTPNQTASVTPVTTNSDSFFKDFMKSMSLSSGLMLLLGAYVITCLLGLIGNTAIDLLGAALLIVIGCAMSLLVIQRVAEDRSKIDLCSWTAIGSAIAMPIAMYLGRSGVNDMGLDVFEFAKAGDTSEQVIYLRYMIYSGIVFYVIAQLLELISKGFMWNTGKGKFKTTIIIGIVACVSGLLFVMCSKSLSQGILVGWMYLTLFIYVIYFIMLLVNGSGEGASTQGTSVESPSSASSAPSSDSSSIKWIAGIAVLIFLAFILFILLANKGKDDAPSGVPGVEYGADYQDPENDAPRYEDYN